MDVLTQRGNLVNVLPAANAAMNTSTDIINIANYNSLSFVLHKGAGAVGTTTVTVDVCDDVSPSNTAKVGYKYRRYDSVTGNWGALTDRTYAQNFVTTAQANDLYEITVDPAAVTNTVVNGVKGNHYVRLCLAQVDATAVYHGVVAVLGHARYGQDDPVDPLV